jgi:nucleoside-diphosphate-sugar epimerase
VKVLITGGTGFVGSHTTAAVLARGHQVRLLVRDRARVRPALAPLGVATDSVEIVLGDVTDPAAVRQATDGVDAVIHLAQVFSMDSRDFRRMRAVNVPGTRLVLDAARQAGADPIVYASSYAALLPSRTPLTTQTPPGPGGAGTPAYFAAQAEAEHMARAYQAEGAPVVIVYLLATLGPHDPHLGDQATRLRNTILGRLRFPPQGGFTVDDVREVAELLARTLTPGEGARRFFPPGYYLSTRDYVANIGTAIGRRLHVVHPPPRPALALCRMVDVVQHVVPWHIPAEYSAAYMCYCDARISDEVPVAPLGVAARPLQETLGDAIRWLYQNGHLTAAQAGLAAVGALTPAR